MKIGGRYHIPYAPCMVYLPTELGDFVRAHVGKYSINGAYMVYKAYCSGLWQYPDQIFPNIWYIAVPPF